MNTITHWHFFWLASLSAGSAVADPVSCVVARHPTEVQIQQAKADLGKLADQYNNDASTEEIKTQLLERMFQRFPVPFTGVELASRYLNQEKYDAAERILLEVSMQDPGLYGKPDPQREAVTKSRELRNNLPKAYQERKVLIIRMHGAASAIKVWLDQSRDDRLCTGPLQVSPGEHQIYWKAETPACQGSRQIKLTGAGIDVIDIDACETTSSTQQSLPEVGATGTEPASAISQWLTLIGGGVAIVGLGAAVAFNLHATNIRDNADCPNSHCSPTGATQIQSAMTSRDWGTASYVVGGVGLGVAAVSLFVWHPWGSNTVHEPQKETGAEFVQIAPTVGANGAGVSMQGSF